MAATAELVNALSFDVEDWFCVHNLSEVFTRADWDRLELRADGSTRRLLTMLERHETRATFFVLGWFAERAPEVVREIFDRGHEVAVHGYGHQLLTELTPESFEADLVHALRVLKACGLDEPPIGFRAPSFSVVRQTEWAFEVLERHGFRYDSSVFPVGFHPDYGIGDAPLTPYAVSGGLTEFPLTCVEFLGKRVPCSGGGYFRLLPYVFTRACLRKVNREGRPAVFYLHPWELDPDQPRVSLPRLKRFRHYTNLALTEPRLERLLGDFRFTTMKEVLGL